METYTLTKKQAREYDESDERGAHIINSLRRAYQVSGPAAGDSVALEIRHPDGYVIEQFSAA